VTLAVFRGDMLSCLYTRETEKLATVAVVPLDGVTAEDTEAAIGVLEGYFRKNCMLHERFTVVPLATAAHHGAHLTVKLTRPPLDRRVAITGAVANGEATVELAPSPCAAAYTFVRTGSGLYADSPHTIQACGSLYVATREAAVTRRYVRFNRKRAAAAAGCCGLLIVGVVFSQFFRWAV
jgi:hypothetical protein